jgi:hypothetical protein
LSPLALKAAEPIAGYSLKERIGAGGYGEVWKAEAPGGLNKAIKFVFGLLDQQRAVCELKALKRIKEVRHPFLLSLERIEVVDGQLVIITELADQSLKDRFEECKKTGASGIPRDELLVYLRDAADALDYMSEHYSLQHLDVKPENLLIVGGRVKVADFGLVKDIHDATVSLLGGLTPVYAAPEVYEGRPSLQSDQYSLAIVYQEMLAGVLPFPGRTPAQLAAQHLNARPRLGPLPERDRLVIARALSKHPTGRYPNCRTMVGALLEPSTAPPSVSPAEEQGRADDAAAGPPAVKTLAVESKAIGAGACPVPPKAPSPASIGVSQRDHHLCSTASYHAAGESSDAPADSSLREPQERRSCEAAPDAPPQDPQCLPLPAAAPAVFDLAPIAASPEEARFRPTLVLGIGGIAACTLRRLQGRLNDRFGPSAALPGVQLLLVDSDARTCAEATQGDEMTVLRHHQTLALGLRPAHQYRTASDKVLQWLSRRWLYNIPRSLQTEGIRPLGRLAMVDHAGQLLQCLRKALTDMTAADAVAASAKTAGLEVGDGPPRVFVVASISGGTGSGMVLDLAYVVRKLLGELGHSDEGVCGLLIHSAPRGPNERKLAGANAYACLSELGHYARRGGYPGEPACGIPPFAPGIGPFHQTYVVHLGDDLDQQGLDAAADRLAEYLYLNSVTTATAFFDKCRAPVRREAGQGGELEVRTFGLCQIGHPHASILGLAVKLLCRRVVERWSSKVSELPPSPSFLGKPAASTPAAEDHRPEERLAHSLQLGTNDLTALVEELVRKELAGDPEHYLRAVFHRVLQHQPTQSASPAPGGQPAAGQPSPGVLLEAVHNLLGVGGEETGAELPPDSLRAVLEDQIKGLTSGRASDVCQWVLQLVDSPQGGLERARQAAAWFVAHLRSIEVDLGATLKRTETPAADLERALIDVKVVDRSQGKSWLALGRGQKPAPGLDPRWLDYGRIRLHQVTLLGIALAARSIRAQVAAVGDRLADLKREIVHLADQFDVPASWAKSPPARGQSGTAPDDPSAKVIRALQERIPEMAAKLDRQLREEVLAGHGGLCGLLRRDASLRRPLLSTLRAAARAAVSRELTGIGVAHALAASAAEPQRTAEQLQACLQEAAPRLSACGGARRLLAVCPEDAADATLREIAALEQNPSVLPDADGDLTMCFEMEQLPITQVAAALIDYRPELAEIASRVHTRTDVRWTGLC